MRGDDEGEGAARRALAEALLAAGDSRRRGGASKVRGRVRGERRGRRGAREGVLRAGEDSRRRGEHEDVVRWFERFYELAERCDDGRLRDVAGKSGRRQGVGQSGRSHATRGRVGRRADAGAAQVEKLARNFGYAA